MTRHWLLAIAATALLSGTGTLVALHPAFAQEERTRELVQPETPEERLNRMLRAFDDPASYQGGVVIVSFADETTREEARAILQSYQLSIATAEICDRAEVGNPGEPPQLDDRGCRTEEQWVPRLTMAYVSVPAGREREYAELLIQDEDVAWVDPSHIAVPFGSGGSGNGSAPAAPRAALDIWRYLVIGGVGLITVIVLFRFFARRRQM